MPPPMAPSPMKPTRGMGPGSVTGIDPVTDPATGPVAAPVTAPVTAPATAAAPGRGSAASSIAGTATEPWKRSAGPAYAFHLTAGRSEWRGGTRRRTTQQVHCWSTVLDSTVLYNTVQCTKLNSEL